MFRMSLCPLALAIGAATALAQNPAPVTSRKHAQKTASATGWRVEGIRTMKESEARFASRPYAIGSTQQSAVRARPLIDHDAQIVQDLDGGFYIAPDGNPFRPGGGR